MAMEVSMREVTRAVAFLTIPDGARRIHAGPVLVIRVRSAVDLPRGRLRLLAVRVNVLRSAFLVPHRGLRRRMMDFSPRRPNSQR